MCVLCVYLATLTLRPTVGIYSEMTAYHARAEDITGRGENDMVSTSRISVVARKVDPSRPPTMSTRRSPGSSTAARPHRRACMPGPDANVIAPVSRASVVALEVRTQLTTTNDEDPASTEHDGCAAAARREHLRPRIERHRAKIQQPSRERAVETYTVATDEERVRTTRQHHHCTY